MVEALLGRLMQSYKPEQVRDETLTMLDRLQTEREQKLVVEIQTKQSQLGSRPANKELKVLWGMEAKVEAQFAYMRRLIRTEGFVVRTMGDFDSLDSNGSGRLEPAELQEFVKRRDGLGSKLTIVQARAKELLKDLDVDGDGRVSRTEWLLYMTYLHWQAFIEENVVEKVVEVTKEFKTDKAGHPVLVENIVQHQPVMRKGKEPSSPSKLDAVRTNTQTDLSVVESVTQNPDGTVVTTIEHLTLEAHRKKMENAAWCGAC